MKLFIGLLLFLLPLKGFSQDLIIKHDSLQIKAKVLEISETDITFKNPENLEGPSYVLRRTEVYKIVYPNGKETIFGDRPASQVKGGLPTAPAPSQSNQAVANPQRLTEANTYNTGQLDAVNLYNAKGHFWAMAATTLLTAGIGGIVVGGIMAAVPPDLDYQPVPDRALLNDQNYRNGYKKQAYRKKVASITAGFSVGITALLIIVLATPQ